jgi:RecJ-like exonuclease
MSIQQIKQDDELVGEMITCDICGVRMFNDVIDWGEWDWSWHKHYAEIDGAYTVKHLCDRCRGQVSWCDPCQTFHCLNGTHRVTCTQCGRTFVSFVNRPSTVCARCAGTDQGRWLLAALDRE